VSAHFYKSVARGNHYDCYALRAALAFKRSSWDQRQ